MLSGPKAKPPITPWVKTSPTDPSKGDVGVKSRPKAGGEGTPVTGSGRSSGGWFGTLLDRGLTYYQAREAEKKAAQMRAQGLEADVVPRGDGTYGVVEKVPFWQDPKVLLGAGVLIGLAIYFGGRRRNPPRRRR